MKGQVNVTGLRDLGKALAALETQAPQPLREVMKDIANDVVQDAARRVPHKSGRAASSYKARGGVKGASIAFGGSRAEYAPWLDFGGRVGRNKSVNRKFIKGGRYLYPAIGDNLEHVQARVVAAINDLTRKYGIKAD